MQDDLLSDGIPKQLWDDFKLHRKNKKAAITKTVMAGFRREAMKAGISLEEAITISIERNWTFFRAEWIEPKKMPITHEKKKSARQQLEEYKLGRAKNIIIDE